MKSIIKKLFMLGAVILASMSVSKVHATTGITASSTTASFMPFGGQPIPAFLVRRGESLYATIASTGNGPRGGTTVQIEVSDNGQNWRIAYATASGTMGQIATSTITFPISQKDSYYRFNVLASSNGALCLTFQDVDDFVSVQKSNKGLDSVYFNDDSVQVFGTLKPNRFQYQQSGSSMAPSGVPSTLVISSFTQFVLGQTAANNKQYSVDFTTNIQPLETNFVVMSFLVAATSATMQSLPVISTQTAQNGDTITFMAMTSTVAFNSDTQTAGTGLKLGANTRSLGNRDILQLIYFNGFWHELFYVDNKE